MSWITHICRSVQFIPWENADKLAEDVLNDHNTLLPETREFLDFYLPNDFCDDYMSTISSSSSSLSASSSCSTSSSSLSSTSSRAAREASMMSPLDSLEILLTATTTSSTSSNSSDSPNLPRLTTARSQPTCSEFGFELNPSLPPPTRITTISPHLSIYQEQQRQQHHQQHENQLQNSSVMAKNTQKLPMLSIHTVPQTVALLLDGTRASSTRAVASSLAALFSDERYADPSRRDIPAAQASMRAVARTVTQALLSMSGCAGLTNGLHALLFQVVTSNQIHQDVKKQEKPVVVRVSQMFGVSGMRAAPRVPPPPAVHALAGLSRFASTITDRDATLAKRVRACAVVVGSAHTQCVFEDLIPPVHGWRYLASGGDGVSDSSDSESENDNESDGDTNECNNNYNYNGDNNYRGSYRRKRRRSIGQVEEFDTDDDIDIFMGGPTKTIGMRRSRSGLSCSSNHTDIIGGSRFLPPSISQQEKKLKALIRRHSGVIGIGNSGVVLESVLQDGRRVAVKLWNESNLDGLRDMLDEITLYKGLMAAADEKNPNSDSDSKTDSNRIGDVAGYAVPRMLMSHQGTGAADTFLVTELVGMGLKRADEGVLMIGHGDQWDFVDSWEEPNIIRAAKKSLQMLHRCGIAHGDVCLENLRVDRRRTFRGWLWHAWWVDLGNAEDDCGTHSNDGNYRDEYGVFQYEMDRVERVLDVEGY